MSSSDTQHAFVERLDRHRGILLKVARAYCRNSSDREDLVQEIIGELWRSYERFAERSSFSTWMYRIALNVAISFCRRDVRAHRRAAPVDGSILERTCVFEDPRADDRVDRLHELIDNLDSLNRALMLLYLDDYPYAEIAAILGISETNVATKIARIKTSFKRTLVANGE
ncbi:MAG: RNA polymerase sigma factor [Candidatus Eremiobacteraeota bacterium]|nr:RNA polymerase sigma factor [Candidatus Eremiobacteraeota bacterium]